MAQCPRTNAAMRLPAHEPRLQAYLSVRNAAAAIDFYTAVFGMTERYRLPMGDRIGHAELELEGVRLLLADEFPESDVVGPTEHRLELRRRRTQRGAKRERITPADHQSEQHGEHDDGRTVVE